MSDESGASQQVIALPKGGGALSGIGEAFSPDLHTGTGNFTVPIALPPGRHGFQPQLSLTYSTGQGNGPFGLGWSLSIPGVSRKTSRGIPRYRDHAPDAEDRDTFILSGAEDLVAIPSSAAGITEYRPRTEGLFARITRHHDAENDYWEVQSKDGLVSRYGTLRPDGVDDWYDPTVVANPDNRSHIFAWKLSQTEDPFGNRIAYRYRRELGSAHGQPWEQLYLSEIWYADYGDDPENRQYLSRSRLTTNRGQTRSQTTVPGSRSATPFVAARSASAPTPRASRPPDASMHSDTSTRCRAMALHC